MTYVQVIVFLFLAMPDTKNTTQPIAIVHPLRTDQQSCYVSTPLTNDTQDQVQNLSDVQVTVISSESPPPVTYIGNPSEELGETSEVSEDPSTEVACTDCQQSVVVESDHEFVMVPGEVIRRRGSILKNPNAPVSDYSALFILREVLFNQTSC